MGFLTKAACGAAQTYDVSRYGLWLVFFGLALATFDFLDGFAWLRRQCLRLRGWVYKTLRPSIRPVSAGDYWLISVVLLVAALTSSVLKMDAGRAPMRFFIYATLGLAVIVRLYLAIYAIEKTQLARPPKRTADWLLARISTERNISPAYAGSAGDSRRRRPTNILGLLILVPLTYLWQTVTGVLSVVVWTLYSPILLLNFVPGKLIAYCGVAIALAGFLLPRTCH